MADHEMEGWIIFDGSIPLSDFLEKNRPTSMKFVNMAVFAGDAQRRPTVFEFPLSIPEPRKQMLLEKWEKLRTKKRGEITNDDVKHLAKKHSYKSGKWLFNCPSTKIDEIWTSVAEAVVSGTLGSAANVFLSDNQLMEYTILVYNEDFTKKEQVWAVERSLRTLGVTFTLRYKPNIYTTLGIYAGNEWHLEPTIYHS